MGEPLFILSFRHRDELSRLAESAGWRPVEARRGANSEARFVASGASVAVVDARGALGEGEEAARAIGDAAEANAAALLVLLSRGDTASLESFHQHGATHFLVSPFTEAQFLHALQFARRHAERTGGTRREEADGKAARRTGLADPKRKRDPEDRRARDRSGGARDAPDPAGDGVQEGSAARNIRDSLTGLGNGRAARNWIAERLAQAGDAPALVVLLLSVSRYDAINAAFGRATGDAVLRAAARRIERQVADQEGPVLVARMAGAEFAVLLAPPAGLGDARFLAGRLVTAIGRPFASGDHLITLGSRAGIAAAEVGDDAAALLRRASAALAEARAGDGPPVHVQEQGAESAAARGERLEVDLRRALDQDEIEILFQPQVSVTDGRIAGVEALARWSHPAYGELGAATLFAVAEGSDYLAQLSDHVQRKAVLAAAGWPEALGGLRLSVNVTAADIVRPGFAARFLAMVEESRFDPARLTVEVTEGGLIEDLGAAAGLLAELRGGGLRVAIDDFGTGYSSLAYLKALPLDYLKIDKRLVQDIAGGPRDRIVVRSVIDMARSLGLDVIAEGVETDEQLGLLAEEGVNLYQGFLCSPPVAAKALLGLVVQASSRA